MSANPRPFTAEMIAPCGLDCSLCKRALAQTDPCAGCRGSDEHKPAFCSSGCGIILCRRRKENGYVFCDECPDFPCDDVMEKEHRYTSKYPLCESPLQNLRSIRENGMEAFLESQRKQWTCPACGGVICVHTGACGQCGKRYGAEVIRVNDDTWRIEDGGVRFFLLIGSEKALLIDSGMNCRHAREIAESLTSLPVSLLNTHADRDHIACNGEFDAFYMHPADEPAYRALGKGGRLIPVKDGDEIDLGGRRLRIIHLPGHTPGSIAVLDIGRRVLISGDPIQDHGRIFMFGSHRNMRDYIDSLERLETCSDRFDEIWPSHADIPISPETIGKLRDGARQIMSGTVAGRPADMFGHPITAYDLGFCTLLCDPDLQMTGA